MEAITISKEGKTITITTHFPEIGNEPHIRKQPTKKEQYNTFLEFYNR
jgi:hypothetical protein